MAEAEAWVMIPKLDKDKAGCVLDMRPLVLCKDCRFSILIPPCNQRKCNGAMEKIVSDDFFCADGERSNGE